MPFQRMPFNQAHPPRLLVHFSLAKPDGSSPLRQDHRDKEYVFTLSEGGHIARATIWGGPRPFELELQGHADAPPGADIHQHYATSKRVTLPMHAPAPARSMNIVLFEHRPDILSFVLSTTDLLQVVDALFPLGAPLGTSQPLKFDFHAVALNYGNRHGRLPPAQKESSVRRLAA